MTTARSDGERRSREPMRAGQVQQLLDLYGAGASLKEAAAQVGCSFGTAFNHLRRAGILRSRSKGAKAHYLRLVHEGRPRTRGECLEGPRPCPWASCRYSLRVDVSPGGRVVEHELREGGPSCVLDVADAGGATLEDIGRCFGRTRERMRQVEDKALRRLAAELGPDALERLLPERPERSALTDAAAE